MTYPASKRSEIFEQMHEAQNWLTIENDGWHLPATKEPKEDCGKWLTKGCNLIVSLLHYNHNLLLTTYQLLKNLKRIVVSG